MEKEQLELLQTLVNARGPCGEEDEVRDICQNELRSITENVWTDAAGNLVGKISGSEKNLEAVRLMVHMDEISLIVKRINEDGSLRLNPLGGLFPYNLGQGPLEVLGDKERFTGVLSFGSVHTTKESPNIIKMIPEEFRGQGKAPVWEEISLITRKTPAQLKEAGVHPGTRVVISQSRRQLHVFQDCVAGYFLDNRASILIALMALKNMKLSNKQPKRDIYFVATCSEELGAHGASYAARTLPGEITLAVDVGPVAAEYQTVLSPAPIVVYQDAITVYDKKICDKMLSLGEKLGLQPQCATWDSYASDASLPLSRGQTAKAALLCFPVENTHGFEIAHQKSFEQCAALLESYLLD